MSSPADFILPRIRRMHGYVPGLQLNDPEIIKLNTNENPFPMAAAARKAVEDVLNDDRLHLYPEPRSTELRQALAEHYGVTPEHALIGNGSDEILTILFRSLFVEGHSLVIAEPTYSLYPTLAELVGADVIRVPVREDWQMDMGGMLSQMRHTDCENPPRLAIITNPNAPTSMVLEQTPVLDFAAENPSLTLVDEAYADFGNESVARFAGSADYPRLMVCGTFSKTYSLAGGRVGWLLAHPEIIEELDKVRDSYNLNRLTQAAALAALRDQDELRRRIQVIIDNRNFVVEGLAKLGFTTLPGHANFIFTSPPENFAGGQLPDGRPAESRGQACYEFLKSRKILVRFFPGERTSQFVRITIGTREQMQRLLQVLAES